MSGTVGREKKARKKFPELKNSKLSSRVTSLKSPVTLHSAHPSQPQLQALASAGIGDSALSRVLATGRNPFQNEEG